MAKGDHLIVGNPAICCVVMVTKCLFTLGDHVGAGVN